MEVPRYNRNITTILKLEGHEAGVLGTLLD